MWRLLKAALTIVALLLVALFAIGWMSLSRAANHAANRKLDAQLLAWTGVRASLLPPSAVVKKPMLKRGLLSAKSARFYLLPGAWTRHGAVASAPAFDEWLLELRLPREAGCNCASILDGRSKLPSWPRWRGKNGRIVVEAGPLAFEAFEVDARREEETLTVRGVIDGRPEGALTIDGSFGVRAFEGKLHAGPIAAAPISAVLVDPVRGRVIGGTITIDAVFAVEGSRVTIKGTIATDGIALERKSGSPTAIELAIEDGHARLGLSFDEDVGRGADWGARFRQSLFP